MYVLYQAVRMLPTLYASTTDDIVLLCSLKNIWDLSAERTQSYFFFEDVNRKVL